MTAFDVAAILIVLVSALIGFARGAVREVVTLAALAAAAIVAILALPFVGPPMRRLVHPAWVGSGAAVLVVFVLVYVLVRVIGGELTRRLHATRLGGADRTLGAGFGIVRALVVLGGFFLLYNAAMPPSLSPGWITSGLTWPVARASGRALQKLAPSGGRLSGGMGRMMRDGVRQGFAPADAEAPSAGEDGGGMQLGGDRAPPPSLDEAAPPDEAAPAAGRRRGLQVNVTGDHARRAAHARRPAEESSR